VTAVRWVTGAVGAVLVAYGGWLLLTRGHDRGDVLVWLVSGVLLHDGVLAPALVVLGALAARLVPGAARAPVVVGLIVLGSTTLLAVPVLGRFGARTDNPTLLDRDYHTGWLVLVVATTVVVVVATLVRSLRDRERR